LYLLDRWSGTSELVPLSLRTEDTAGGHGL